MELYDGTVIEASCPVTEQSSSSSQYNDVRIYKAQVEEVVYADSSKNKSGNVEYNLIMFTGNSLEPARPIKNAVTLNSLGGINDYSEVVYKEKTRVYTKGTNGAKDSPENTNGDMVALFFLEGNETMPVILGPWSHKKNTKAATATDGHRIKGEYNGVEWEINKDGEFILTILGGPRDDDGGLTNEDNGGLLIKFEKDGKISIDSGDDAILTIDKNTKTIELDADIVKVGTSAAQSIVRGDAFKTLFEAHTHPTPAGPSGIPFQTLTAGVELSDKHKVE